MDGHQVAFVFPAGGSAGAVQVGILRALFYAGVVPDVVVGCSVGAINAAYLALEPSQAQVERLAEVWLRLQRAEVFGHARLKTAIRLARRCDHIYDSGPLRALIARFCTIEDLADAAIPVHIVTTDLEHAVARWWTRGPAQQIIYASACLPGLFEPAALGGSRHVDGGVLEPVPVSRAMDTGAETVFVLGSIDGPPPLPARPLSALEVLLHSFAVKRYGELPDAEALARPGQRVVVVPGADVAGIELRDFSRTRALIDDSERLARQYLSQFTDLVAEPSLAGRDPGA